jgi:AAA domain-containing protein
MQKPFVVISGLPASGKTRLASRLAPAMNLPLIDKDDILDRLFESRGIGDAEWRNALSRESDAILQQEAMNSSGAVLVSFWRVPGMAQGSGTPSDWLHAPSHDLVNVHCVCDPETAVFRFVRRVRHPGHLDRHSTYLDVLNSLRALTCLEPVDLGRRIEIDTTFEPNIEGVVRAIRSSS